MSLAYAQRANDVAYLSQHYPKLDQWTQYLIEEALIPANQISTDDFAGALAYVCPLYMDYNTYANLIIPKKPDKSGAQGHHRYWSHGCYREHDWQHRHGSELHIYSPKLHHAMASPRHRP